MTANSKMLFLNSVPCFLEVNLLRTAVFPRVLHRLLLPVLLQCQSQQAVWLAGPFTECPACSQGHADVGQPQVTFDTLDDGWQGHGLAQGAQPSHSSVGKKRLKNNSNYCQKAGSTCLHCFPRCNGLSYSIGLAGTSLTFTKKCVRDVLKCNIWTMPAIGSDLRISTDHINSFHCFGKCVWLQIPICQYFRALG